MFHPRAVPVRWRARLWCALLVCLAGLGRGAAPPTLPSYSHRVWQTEDGLPENVVTAVVQTRDGYLWVGTYDGLARFDGAGFTVFDDKNTPEMSSSRVISLFEDREGNLWIGHETGELTRYRDGHFYTVKFNPPWENHKIVGIGTDRAGRLWVLNEEGKLAGANGSSIHATRAHTAPARSVRSLAASKLLVSTCQCWSTPMARSSQGTVGLWPANSWDGLRSRPYRFTTQATSRLGPSC